MKQYFDVSSAISMLPRGFHLFLDGKDVTDVATATEFDEHGGWVTLYPYERREDGKRILLSNVTETRHGKIEMRKVE
jgi:hypothetical protein